MTIQRKYRMYKKFSIVMLAAFLFELFTPTVAWALTSGPTQPEFSSFEPVATTNMVDVFSGDLTYNLPVLSIPGANGGGYAMSLSYHSGSSPEEEASWVGYGWSLNPGAINRNKRGFPDDWKSQQVTYYNKAKPNTTVSLGAGIHPELFSSDDIISISANASIRYNNYKGFGYNAGIGIALGKGVVSLGYNVSDGEGSYSLALNPANALRFAQTQGKKNDKKSANNETKPKADKESKVNKMANSGFAKGLRKSGIGSTNLIGSNYGIFSYGYADRATSVVSYSGKSYNVTVGATGNPGPVPIGGSAELTGNLSRLTNTEAKNINSYGYMYSGDSQMSPLDIMDYYTEKNTPYDKNDRFLGIPFGNPDNFNVSGEGIGGGFRLYHKKVGQFRPNMVFNETEYKQVGAAFDVGSDVGGGADKDAGKHFLTTTKWSGSNDFYSDGVEDEPYFFRFNQDMGGYVTYGSSDVQRAGITGGGSKGNKAYDANTSGITRVHNSGSRNKRSTFVGYNTNAEMQNNLLGDNYYSAYSKEMVNTVDRSNGDLIGEFSITNEDGNMYNYGLPVHSKSERQIQMGMEGLSGSNLQNMYLAYKNDDIGSNKTYVGEKRDQPYAASYLLTSITTPDFIDRTNNGPSPDDFGGYTKFVYKKYHGDQNWYRWRMPYRGMLYQRNSLSDASDDLGSYTSGEKEIYLLDSIVTKTHYAVFRTSEREDALGALPNNIAAVSKVGASVDLKLQKLDKIELYAKGNGTPKLLKTVHFSYDYSLCSGLPNSINGGGKLTLKRVWFEHEGIVETKISPYKFEYEYPSITYPGKYNGLDMYNNTGLTAASQNPNYSSFMLDAWGNYQGNGASRYAKMQNWVDQDKYANYGWDPAAWQLKVIKLPSGGEIHVQYEMDDYSYVQNKRAMAMVSIKGRIGDKYYLDLAELEVSDTLLFVEQLKKQFVQGKERIHFKFLYNLTGTSEPSLTHCNAEYIDGYAIVQSVGFEGGSSQHDGVYITLSNSGNHGVPDKVCKDFVRTQRAGMLTSRTNCDPSEGIPNKGAIEVLRWFGTWIGNLFKPSNICAQMNKSLSYFRVPLTDAKKGGGIRVKRLMMYDSGIESGDAALYGSEYVYKHYDQELGKMMSSGVATNEPASIRAENALVGFMDRFASKSGFLNKVIAGRDRETSEGPLGESLLPGPSVGYSKVYIKNIHSGKTNPGFTVNEFYTAKDYPSTYTMTSIDEKTDNKSKPYGVHNSFLNNVWLSQGFSFKIYSFHGKPKSQAAYSGDYTNMFSTDKNALISLTEHKYYEPEELIPVMKHSKKMEYEPLGREMDIAMESQMVGDYNSDTRMEYDGSVGLPLGIPFFFSVFSYTVSEMEMYRHTTSKVTRYPAIEKGQVTYRDGMYRSVNYLAFDKFNGKPIVTKRKDGFDKLNLLASNNHKGDYYDYRIPASYNYSEMTTKATNERRLLVSGVTNGVTITKYSSALPGAPFTGPVLRLTGGDFCDFADKVAEGDLVELLHENTSGDIVKEVYHLGSIYINDLQLVPTSFGSYGVIGDGKTVNMNVVRSGRSNQLNTVAGTFTTYGNDLTGNTLHNSQLTQRQLVADDLNTYLWSNPPFNDDGGLNATSFSNGLEFIDIANNCNPLDNNYFIRLEENKLKLYHKSRIKIIGDHPFVDQLNDYFDKYLSFPLSVGGGVKWNQSMSRYNATHNPSGSWPFYGLAPMVTSMSVFNAHSVYDLAGTGNANAMRSQQGLDFGVAFNDVNDQSQSVGDFFSDLDAGTDNAIAVDQIGNPSVYENKRVLIQHLASGGVFGTTPTLFNNPAVFWLPGPTTGDVSWLPMQVGQGIAQKFTPFYYETNVGTAAGFGSSLNLAVDSTYLLVDPKYYHRQYTWNAITHVLPAGPSSGFFMPLAGGEFGQNSDGYLTWKYDQDIAPGGGILEEEVIPNIRFFYYDPICTVDLDLASGGGHFGIDPNTGQLMHYAAAAPCQGVPIPCLSFCEEESSITQAANVIDAQVSTFHDAWEYEESDYAPYTLNAAANVYELGKKGQFRQLDNYVYRTDIGGLTQPYTSTDPNKIYNSGTYTLELFNFEHLPANDGTPWIKTTTVNSYSPNGNALQEQDILNIHSATKFGYSKSLPYLLAKNTRLETVYFESFENDYHSGTYLEDGVLLTSGMSLTTTEAHSGQRAAQRTASTGTHALFALNSMDASSLNNDEELLVKVWLKGDRIWTPSDFTANSTPFTFVANRGEWSLYEARLDPAGSGAFNISINYKFNNNHTVWIDDMRIQPADAQMTCYVYDVTSHRLTASFDDQHFGRYYQYNAKGQLVRKQKETERGLKTIQETQYHQPKWDVR